MGCDKINNDQSDLEKENHEYFMILESISQGISVFSPDLKLIFGNETCKQLIGLPDDLAVPGTDFADIIRYNAERGDYGPGDVEQLVAERVELARQFKPHKFQRTAKDGKILEIEGRNVKGIGFVTTYTDVSKRVQAEEELRSSEMRLREIINTLPFALSIWDDEERLEMSNGVLGRWFPKLAAYDNIGSHLSEVIRQNLDLGYVDPLPDDPEAYIRERIDSFRNPPDNEMNLQFFADRWLQRINERLPSGGGVAIRIDVTEQHQRDEQLRQAQKMEAVGQLTGGIAHDFNNLLATIIGNAEFLEENIDTLGDASRKNLDAISRAAFRGAELTNRLLSFSRKYDLSPCEIHLNQTVRNLMGLLQRSIGASIEFEVNFESELWTCYADPGQVESTLLNLAINARDAMPNGGKVTIETANVILDNAHLPLEDKPVSGSYVMLSVTDTGDGIAEDNIAQIFEPFFTTKEVGKGSGLGLSMVFGFAMQSDGHISVDSEPGRGSCFRIYLPQMSQSST